MTRTTVAIDERLLRALKKRAAEEGRTLQAVVNEVLRLGMASTAGRGERYALTLQGWPAREQAGVDVLDRDKLFDLMDGR